MYRTALARTHRPRSFSELVGQDHIGPTLRAAIESERVGHAYLFCGPRGVGKTTAARVLAMALNCPDTNAGDPCGTCESCERIWSGRASLDVVEIDAASHRGVDDARDLRERAMYAPSGDDRYKVYIVDEAHMLTRDAWNALLKILEEPPPRVIFAFATTEPQKIEQGAAPVMSRCQRFDFRRVSVKDITSRLETVLEREGVEADPGAIRAIARRAEGGVRDSLSLLDQVLSFSGDRLDLADVRRMLGLVDEDRYLEFFGIAATRDRARVFSFVQELLDDGHDPAEFMRGLGDALRTLLVVRLDPEADSVELLPESRARFVEAASASTPSDLLRMLAVASEFEASGTLHRSSQQRIQLEVLLLRLVSMESTVELEALLAALGTGGDGDFARPAAPTPPAGTPDRPASPPASNGGGAAPAPKRAEVESGGADPGQSAVLSGRPPASVAESPPEPATRDNGSEAPTSEQAAPQSSPAAPQSSPAAPQSNPAANGSRNGSADAELSQVWAEAVSEAPTLGGAAIALRGVQVTEIDGSKLKLRVPAGLRSDLEDLLADANRCAPLLQGVAQRLSLPKVDVEIVEADRQRMTAEGATQDRVERWMERDPGLRQAVEHLDLTFRE